MAAFWEWLVAVAAIVFMASVPANLAMAHPEIWYGAVVVMAGSLMVHLVWKDRMEERFLRNWDIARGRNRVLVGTGYGVRTGLGIVGLNALFELAVNGMGLQELSVWLSLPEQRALLIGVLVLGIPFGQVHWIQKERKYIDAVSAISSGLSGRKPGEGERPDDVDGSD